MNQIELHKKIDETIRGDFAKVSKEHVLSLMKNHDTKNYFFSKADERWLSWLWKNGFLDAIKKKSEDPTRYLRTPELNYLVRMAEKDPKTVTSIMLNVPVSLEVFNPEVIEQFLWICDELPAEELARMLPKIQQERWIPLMKDFGHSGFRFEKMFKTLSEASDDVSILLLSSVMLSVREKKSGESEERNFWENNPFYFAELEDSGVFDALEKIGGDYLEEALALVSETMRKVIFFNEGKHEPKESFKIGDGFAFYDVDFFTMETGQKNHISYRDDVRELATVLKSLIVKIFRKCDSDTEKIREVYKKYIDIPVLPDSQAMWRFRLFVFSLSRDTFAREIKQSLFRISEVARPSDLTSGAEYEHLLKENLDLFSEDEKQSYKKILFDLIGDGEENRQLPGGDILGICSIILGWLTDEEKEKVKGCVGKPLNSDYVPEPIISPSRGGSVQARSPIPIEELNCSVSEIAQKLRSEWAPKNLNTREEWTENSLIDFGVEGLGKDIQNDISKRLQEYINNATLFFDPELLDEHYTYAFLHGILGAVKERKSDIHLAWDGLFELFAKVRFHFGEHSLERSEKWRKQDGSISRLAGWNAVYSALADLVGELFKLDKDKVSIVDFKKYREQLLGVIQYLLLYPNPNVESEICKPRVDTGRGDGKIRYGCSDPFTHAINSVRGKAFEALVNFAYRDGEKFSKDTPVKIDRDVKGIYETVLERENTRAMFFLFGHYFPLIYFRDKKWARGFFEKLFDFSPTRRDLSLAAWEGYLVNNLYRDLFQDLEPYYSQAIELDQSDYTPREYFKDIDEALATHIALAFMHFSDFTIETPLFQKFWKKENPKKHVEFVSFIGRYAISRNQAKNWIEQNKIDSKKLENFWDWILEEPIDIKVFESFGFWMDAEWGVFDPIWQAEHVLETLKKTNGATKWDHNLQKSLPIYAKASPEKTLEILRIYMLEYLARRAKNQGWIHMTDEITDVFRVLYENSGTREKTYDLINDLLPYGNGLFWKLKDVIM